jgi:hypothetical protein
MDSWLYDPNDDPPAGMFHSTNSRNNSPTLLEAAQQFSQMAVQHVHQIRQQVDSTNTGEIQALNELTASYDKLSAMKWDAVRKEYEARYRESLEDNIDDMLRDTVPNGCSKTPGKKKPEEINNSIAEGLNPHDWITNAFRNGGVSALGDTRDGFSGWDPTSTSGGLGLPPPGFDEQSERGEQSCTNESFCSSEKNTTQCTSTPSEISSLGTQDASCHEDEGDDSSVESVESETLSRMDFDYVYKGGYAMKVSNGKEIKGVVPKTVKHVFVHSTVTSIDEGAFQGCNELESVTISSSVVNIRDNAFRKCSKLKKVVFLSRRKSNIAKESNNFNEEKKIDHSDGGNQLHSRRSTATSQSSVRSTSRLRTIGEWVFFNCSSLESINLPHGLETIGTRSFQRCSMLVLEELPVTLVGLGENAFSGCSRETRAMVEAWERNRA